MASPKATVALAIAVVFAAVLLLPVVTVIGDHTGTQSVENESVTAELDTWVDLDRHTLVEDSETVLWHNTTSDEFEELTRGTDYEMDYDAGRINVSSGGDVSDGDDLLVSYDWQATTGVTTTIVGLIPLLLAVLIIGVIGQYVANEVG